MGRVTEACFYQAQARRERGEERVIHQAKPLCCLAGLEEGSAADPLTLIGPLWESGPPDCADISAPLRIQAASSRSSGLFLRRSFSSSPIILCKNLFTGGKKNPPKNRETMTEYERLRINLQRMGGRSEASGQRRLAAK